MRDESRLHGECAKWAVCFTVVAVALSGCSHGPTGTDARVKLSEQRVFDLKEITLERGKSLLSELSIGEVSIPSGGNALCVTGTASDLYRAGVVLDLVDTREEFVVETLVPVSDARTIPMNTQIAEAIGGVAIGTFADPPQAGERMRAIIDIHGESVVAILPASIHRELIAFVRLGPEGLRQIRGDDRHIETPVAQAQADPQEAKPSDLPPEVISVPVVSDQPKPVAIETTPATATSMPQEAVTDIATQPETIGGETPRAEPAVRLTEEPLETRGTITVETAGKSAKPAKVIRSLEPVLPGNAEDVLQLDLPDRLEMIQLLDLVAEYLRLDYMYEPEKIKGQAVSLRLHGKLQGEVRVKDLYPLLESVLKFKGFAMTCHKGNLVTIVPVSCSARPMRLTACCSHTYVIPIQHPA